MANNYEKTILLVDDSTLFLSQMKDLLGEASFRTMECSDSRQARDIIEDRHGALDLIITDLNMPGWDGFELISWLRDQPFGPDIPVLVATAAYELADVVDRLNDLRVNGMINKGAHPHHVLTRVNSILFPEMKEKRQYERVSVHIPSGYALDGVTHAALITNLSLGGCFLATDYLAPANENVTVKIALSAPQRIIHQSGEVVWVIGKESWSGKKQAFQGLGVRWTDMTRSVRLFLESYIEDVLKTERLFTIFSP